MGTTQQATEDTAERAEESREIIDFGGHLYSDRVPARPESFRSFDDLIPHFSDPDEIIRQYRAAGITGNVLVAPHYTQIDDVEATAEANDVLLEIVEEHDHFLGGLACIPFTDDGEAAAEEFRRALDNGFNGGVLEAWSQEYGIDLTDEALDPVYDVAERTGAPILVHPKAEMSLHPDIEILDDDYRLNAIFGREVSLWASVCKVVHDGVLDRHPDLNLVYDHIGGNIASLMGRMHYQYETERWPGDDSKMKSWDEFRSQLEERIYLKMAGHHAYQAPLRATLEEFPASQVLFATDFPFEPRSVAELEANVETVEDLTSRADARRIFSENARELLVNLD
ncbi:MAG: amidohydrolase family protein [Salinigranum sp.]